MSDDNLFGANEARAADERAWEEAKRQNRINFKAFLMTIAIVIAPFLALIISFDAALIVLAAALGFTTWLTWHVANKVGRSAGIAAEGGGGDELRRDADGAAGALRAPGGVTDSATMCFSARISAFVPICPE